MPPPPSASPPAPTAAPEPNAPAQPLPSDSFIPTAEGEHWYEVVCSLVAADAITALPRELALQSQLVARENGHWQLCIEAESLNQPQARERLRAALQAAGHAQQLSITLGPVCDSPARRNAAAANARQRQAQEIVLGDPLVQALQRDYDGKIVPGSIQPL